MRWDGDGTGSTVTYFVQHSKRLAGRVLAKLRRHGLPDDLPDSCKAALLRDRAGLPEEDPGPHAVIREGVAWLYRAQDHSGSHDGGFARDYSLARSGWGPSYPETTGYIVPTLLEFSRRYSEPEARDRAVRALDWLVGIQFPEGGFQGGVVGATPRVLVTFNTGQILLGLSAGVQAFGAPYAEAMHAAARWLVEALDRDGCWRRFPSPFAVPGEKTYDTHIAWGLFEAERAAPGHGYGEAGLRNVRWALTKQRTNGWFADNALTAFPAPPTHTIGYALRGIIEAYRLSGDKIFLDAACRTADPISSAVGADGHLAACLDSAWRPAADFVCLTGSAQIAHCLLLLYRANNNAIYRDRGGALNSYVRRTINLSGAPEIRGAVKGSFPIDGDYAPFEFPNWATKFTIDANLLELDVGAG